ncbi:unnamed protein product [Linum tenue]|uniref:Ataxin-10 domain-containing protein n=1 Tax=Linum tenue TaxID=586396 RepID=A0AAV0RDY9_9ROSI|nr:unnamed protein product [Linum tenue]
MTMAGESNAVLSLQHPLLLPLLTAAKSSDAKEALQALASAARSDAGRSDLASKNVLPDVLRFVRSLPCPEHLVLALRLLRNLCAGEIANQNSFLDFNGAGIISAALVSAGLNPDSGPVIIRAGLQVLANVGLAGVEHQRAIWDEFFPKVFIAIGSIGRKEISDPLCMILYACCDGSPALFSQLVGEEGLPVVVEIVKTASLVGFEEDWLKLIVSRICIDENLFHSLFPGLYRIGMSDDKGKATNSSTSFSSEQAYLLGMVSEILCERLEEIRTLSVDFALCVLGIFKDSADVLEQHVSGAKSKLPTGSASIDILGYSLTVLKHICGIAFVEDSEEDVVSLLVSRGLLETLLGFLRILELPSTIRRGTRGEGTERADTSFSGKPCPYIGFRRDIVGVIGNCSYRRKRVQDQIRDANGLLLLLQQCVTDDDNPFLREWGIWAMRNVLEGNAENQQAVAELEVQGTVQMPELGGLGLKVEVDQKSGRAKLVNTSPSSLKPPSMSSSMDFDM